MRGGVYAIASIRGGGEEAEDWHRAAMGAARRQVSFNDFQDCAEWLIHQGCCTARTLGIAGGSNGGLLVAACAVQRPDLFGAVVCTMGVLDLLRFPKFTIGGGWTEEYGLPDNPEDFRHLLAFSPLHNVKADVRYPPMLIVTADHDARFCPAIATNSPQLCRAASRRSSCCKRTTMSGTAPRALSNGRSSWCPTNWPFSGQC